MGRVPVVVRVCGSAQRGVAPQVLGTDWSSTPGALEELKRLRLRQQTRNAKRPRALVSGLAPPFQDWHHLEEVTTESTSSLHRCSLRLAHEAGYVCPWRACARRWELGIALKKLAIRKLS